MCWVNPGMQKDDGQGLGACLAQRLHRLAQLVGLGGLLHLAARADALGCFGHRAIQHFRLANGQGEQLRALLGADGQQIAKTLGDQQAGRGALAFQQGIGGHRGTQANPGDALGGQGGTGCNIEQPPNALDGGIGVCRRAAEQFLGMDRAVRGDADNIGERAAAVDGEAPAGGGGLFRRDSRGRHQSIRKYDARGLGVACLQTDKPNGRLSRAGIRQWARALRNMIPKPIIPGATAPRAAREGCRPSPVWVLPLAVAASRSARTRRAWTQLRYSHWAATITAIRPSQLCKFGMMLSPRLQSSR